MKKCQLGTPHYWLHMSVSISTKESVFSWFYLNNFYRPEDVKLCRYSCEKSKNEMRTLIEFVFHMFHISQLLRFMLWPLVGVLTPRFGTLSKETYCFFGVTVGHSVCVFIFCRYTCWGLFKVSSCSSASRCVPTQHGWVQPLPPRRTCKKTQNTHKHLVFILFNLR